MGFFDYILYPFGMLMHWIYMLVQNYGLAIILFTFITKAALLPLNLKQQKSSAQMNLLKPEMDEIQKKYKDDKEKQGQETMKLYKKYGISPLAGCLPMLIQLPIIFLLYQIVTRPMHFILQMADEAITPIFESVQSILPEGLTQAAYGAQIQIAKAAELINFDFLGLDLSGTPQITSPHLIWIIPALAALTTYISSRMMAASTPKPAIEAKPSSDRPPRPGEKKQADPANTMKTMNMIMPFVTLWFSFTLPAGISIYWIAGNLVQMAQQLYVNKVYLPKMRERVALEHDATNRRTRKKR